MRKIFIYLFIYLFTSCTKTVEVKYNFLEKSIQSVGIKEYSMVYTLACDSLKTWNRYDLENYWIRYNQKYKLDSLLCFNVEKDRFIGCIHQYRQSKAPSDNILFLLGEKIQGNWCFFSNATSVTLPRDFYQKTEDKPLTYEKIHEIALKQVYGGYITQFGHISDNWFINEFEGIGWGDFNDQTYSLKNLRIAGQKFTDKRKFFEAIHLEVVRNNWNGVKKDTLQKPSLTKN